MCGDSKPVRIQEIISYNSCLFSEEKQANPKLGLSVAKHLGIL